MVNLQVIVLGFPLINGILLYVHNAFHFQVGNFNIMIINFMELLLLIAENSGSNKIKLNKETQSQKISKNSQNNWLNNNRHNKRKMNKMNGKMMKLIQNKMNWNNNRKNKKILINNHKLINNNKLIYKKIFKMTIFKMTIYKMIRI